MNDKCSECGMPVAPGEFHPYAACLIYRDTQDPISTRSHLEYIMRYGHDDWDGRPIDSGKEQEHADSNG